MVFIYYPIPFNFRQFKIQNTVCDKIMKTLKLRIKPTEAIITIPNPILANGVQAIRPASGTESVIEPLPLLGFSEKIAG